MPDAPRVVHLLSSSTSTKLLGVKPTLLRKVMFVMLLQDTEAATGDANMDDAGADAEAAAGTAPSDGGAAAADAAAEAADAATDRPSGATDGAAAPMETEEQSAQPAATAVKKRTKKIPVSVKAETASIPDPVVQVRGSC